ncbi:MAG: hypothetical protein EOO59_08990, partial [Hymenobacter sp.]
MKFSRLFWLAIGLVLLAAGLTTWHYFDVQAINAATLGGFPATHEPANDGPGQLSGTLAGLARGLALGALALAVAPRRS